MGGHLRGLATLMFTSWCQRSPLRSPTRLPKIIVTILAAVLPLAAQPALQTGDILVTGTDMIINESGERVEHGTIVVFGRDGSRRTLIALPYRFFTDLFYRDGIIYVAARFPNAIERVDSAGNLLTPLTTDVMDPNYLSPGPNGGVMAANASGWVYQFGADGSLIRFFGGQGQLGVYGGLDLAGDGCTVFAATLGSVVRWDACLGTVPVPVTANRSFIFGALRVLRDGTFLVAQASDDPVVHLDRDGTLLREYENASGEGVALDIDGTSFWSGTCVNRLDIASGAVLDPCRGGGNWLAVVGEPRAGLASSHGADIPALPPALLAFLVVALAAAAMLKLRLG